MGARPPQDNLGSSMGAREGLALIGELFAIERKLESESPKKRKKHER